MNNKIGITQQNMSFDGIMNNSQIENSFAEYERSGKPGALPYCFNNSFQMKQYQSFNSKRSKSNNDHQGKDFSSREITS